MLSIKIETTCSIRFKVFVESQIFFLWKLPSQWVFIFQKIFYELEVKHALETWRYLQLWMRQLRHCEPKFVCSYACVYAPLLLIHRKSHLFWIWWSKPKCSWNMLITSKRKIWGLLFNRLLHAETHLGPDGTRLEQNAQARLKSLYKHAGQLVYGNWKRERNRFEWDEGK